MHLACLGCLAPEWISVVVEQHSVSGCSSTQQNCEDFYMLTKTSEYLHMLITCRLSFEDTDWVSDSPCMHYAADTASKFLLGIWLKVHLREIETGLAQLVRSHRQYM